jgi:glycerol uptake facilitator-like aquaporin
MCFVRLEWLLLQTRITLAFFLYLFSFYHNIFLFIYFYSFFFSLLFIFIILALNVSRFDFKNADLHRSLLVVALGDGLAFTVFVFAFMRLSGGYLNPAITWGAIITRRIGLMKGIAYILAQVVGGILGALLVLGSTPDAYHKKIVQSTFAL